MNYNTERRFRTEAEANSFAAKLRAENKDCEVGFLFDGGYDNTAIKITSWYVDYNEEMEV